MIWVKLIIKLPMELPLHIPRQYSVQMLELITLQDFLSAKNSKSKNNACMQEKYHLLHKCLDNLKLPTFIHMIFFFLSTPAVLVYKKNSHN